MVTERLAPITPFGPLPNVVLVGPFLHYVGVQNQCLSTCIQMLC